MQCPVCAKEVSPQSAFCPFCGAAVYAGTPADSNAPPPLYTQPVGTGRLSDTAAATLAYITIIPAIVFLVLAPYNRVPLVRFHAWQCIGLTFSAIVLHLAITMCALILHIVPGFFLMISLLHGVVSLAVFIAWLIAIIKASQGQWFKLPILGDFAEKQARS